MPRLRSIGLMPEATAFNPSRMIACASTVAVVVPSPASSEVLDATSFTICAPMFSNLSFNSISLATDTPSLVTVGAPKLFSSTALRPFGPSVTLTALARMLTPRSIRVRASSLKRTSFAAMSVFSGIRLLLEDRHHVFFAHDEVILAVHLHFGAAVLAEEDVVTDLDVERAHGAVLEDLALADGDDLAADRLLGGAVRNHDAARGAGFGLEPLDDHAIVKRANLQLVCHCCKLRYACSACWGDGRRAISTHPLRLLIIGSASAFSRGRLPIAALFRGALAYGWWAARAAGAAESGGRQD